MGSKLSNSNGSAGETSPYVSKKPNGAQGLK